MTPEQIRLVQRSWEQVLPIAGAAADIFYDTLFELDPGLRPMFASDLTEQKRKLMSMIGRVVSALDRLDQVVADVVELGRRHVGYGVEPAHYDTVGQALLSTLAKGLGDDFSPAVRDAWTAAYGTLAGAMLGAEAERLAV